MTAEDVLWSRDSTALSSVMAAPVLAARSSSGRHCRSSALSQWYVQRQGSALGYDVCSKEMDLGGGMEKGAQRHRSQAILLGWPPKQALPR